MALIEAFIFTSIIAFLLYKWGTAKYDTFRQRGVAHDTPWPLIGNASLGVLFKKKSFLVDLMEQYTKYKQRKVFGQYSFTEPTFFVCDPELIKRVGIKDFDHFPNQRSIISEGANSLLAKSLMSLKGRQWKEMRNTLTPTFTGSKMRLMYELVNACSIEGVKYIEEELKASGKSGIELEMKDYFTRFTNDCIASAAFGIKVNSFENKENEFYTVGKSVTQISTKEIIKFILISCIPKIMKVLGVTVLDVEKQKYFGSLVLESMKYRQQHNIVRTDMIQLLMEAQKQFRAEKAKQNTAETSAEDPHAEFNDEDLLAQCMLFFFAGFDTVSTCLCFTAYELLMNPDVQQQLYEEIAAMNEQLNGEPLNYDALNGMKYLDMVISESLRKWPPAFFLDRECTADIKMYNDNGELLVDFRKGDQLFIPNIALQRDPEYFSDPDKFDPLRFSEERKHEIKPFTYMPFGIGPRNCIGNRMALMEVKSIIYHLVLKFQIVRAEKTAEDMMNDITGFVLQPKSLFWTKFVPREKSI